MINRLNIKSKCFVNAKAILKEIASQQYNQGNPLITAMRGSDKGAIMYEFTTLSESRINRITRIARIILEKSVVRTIGEDYK